MTAARIIQILELKPHPEGAISARHSGAEPASAGAIYFLLGRGEHSHRHRVDASATCTVGRAGASYRTHPKIGRAFPQRPQPRPL
jgi:predicted cupin superfamily sugar epimerase